MARPEDTVATYRGEMLCTSGKAGELAKWTVRENDYGSPSLKLVPWKPFPAAPYASKTGAGAIIEAGIQKADDAAREALTLPSRGHLKPEAHTAPALDAAEGGAWKPFIEFASKEVRDRFQASVLQLAETAFLWTGHRINQNDR